MTPKQKIIDDIILVEGGYVNNPSDSGGETNFGITVGVARRYGYAGPMENMPESMARRIYEDLYWHSMRLDDVSTLSGLIAAELADTGVNMGVGRAARYLQRCLNVFNIGGALYPDLNVDGMIGGQSLEALKLFLAQRQNTGERVMLRALNALQGARYITLAESREKDEEFVFGWLLNRVA